MKKFLAHLKSQLEPCMNNTEKAKAKIWRAVATFFLFILLLSISSTSALAACSPPSDYSSCPTALLGPKIAGNIDPKNYQQIRQQYNQANPSLVNQQIPVTIIYTTADLAPGNLQNTVNNLQAMQQYGLQPVIRIASSGFGAQGWAPITTSEAAAAAQTLNQAFGQINFSQTPVVYFGNEPNLAGEWGGQANALSFAQSFAAFIQAAGSQRNFLIFVPPVATHQGGVEYAFMQQILSYQLANGQTIAQSVNGAALTIYNDNAQSLSALYQQLTQFYGQNGINNFVISEIGPLVNGQLLQNQNQINQWAQIMSGVFAQIMANPSLFAGAQYISTSFFLDLNGDGGPDVTLLVIIDKDGNVIIMNLTSLGGGIMTTPTYGTCQAEQPFPGGAETKGESFTVRVASCFGPADPAEAVNALLKATKLDFPNNKQIADELEWPLNNLKPAGYNPQVLQRTALGKITYDVCEEGTTNWYTVDKEVEFKTPAWMEKMTTEGKELASWLAPGGGQGAVMGEKTQALAINSTPLLAQAGPMVSITSLSCSAGNWQVNCSVNIDATPGTGHVWVSANGKFLGINKTGYGLVYYYDASVSPGTNSFTVNVNVINHDRQPKPEDNASCTIQFDANGNGSCSAGGGMPRPTPTPRICQKYIPQGGNVGPEAVCVGGSCQIKSLPRSSFITQIVNGITQTICPGKTFLVTPKVRTPFVQAADIFLREQTLSVFKVSGEDAEEAFEFEHALENAQHEFTASPPTNDFSETEIYGQRGVKDSYDWVQDALMPAGY